MMTMMIISFVIIIIIVFLFISYSQNISNDAIKKTSN